MEEDHTRNLLRGVALLIALLGILPVGYFVIGSFINEIPDFFDACFTFGDESPYRFVSDPRCPKGQSGTSESRLGVMTRLISFQGAALVAVMVGVIGIYRSSRLISAVGASYLLYLFFPLSAARAQTHVFIFA